MSGIFISYRRSDDPNATGRIYDRLVAEFGRAKVFKDIDSIPLGRDFRTHLNEVVGQCAVVLAIVGPRWVDARGEAGQRRLEDSEDFVRLELEVAMARDVPVVPVLVSHAPMPTAVQLPASLAPLAYRQSIEVRPDPDFHNDATRLATGLRTMLDPKAAALAASAFADPTPTPRGDTQRAPRSRLTAGLLAAAAVVIAALLAPAVRHFRESTPPEIRTDILTPGRLDTLGFALSPDGRRLVFVGSSGGQRRLWLRELAATRAQPLAGAEDAIFPFWSPDGQSIGFFTGNALKRLDLGGGSPHALAPVTQARGGTWNAAGTVVFVPDLYSGLMRVSASGGAVEAVTKLGPKQLSHRFPSFLPDGNRFIYLALGDAEVSGIYLGALDGREPIRLRASASAAVYLPTGWLLWNEAGKLIGQRLDPDKGTLSGTPVTLDPETAAATGSIDLAQVSASATGLMAYRPGAGETRLVWRNRAGEELRPVGGAEGGNFQAPRLSPDGRRIVAHRMSAEGADLWLVDGTRTARFTVDPARNNIRPIWSADGAWVAWGDNTGFNRKLASGAGAIEHLVSVANTTKGLGSWSPDGRILLYWTTSTATGSDLWLLPLEGAREPTAFLQTPFNERGGEFSPDGRWIAYFSDESGRNEVYVRPFIALGSAGTAPPAGAAAVQLSAAGGIFPVWRHDGKELYFLSPAGAMMAVPMATNGQRVVAGVPMELFATRIMGGGLVNPLARQFDVAPDGRFLISSLPDDSASSSITLIQNWIPEGANR